MSEQRKLEEAAARLDDVAVTLDEIGEQPPARTTRLRGALEDAKSAVSDAVDTIEETISGASAPNDADRSR